jgi:hypothetical protein
MHEGTMTPVELDSSALKSSVAFTGRLACMTRAEASRSSANDLMQSASPPGRDPHNRSVKNARCKSPATRQHHDATAVHHVTQRDGISFIDQLLCTNRDDPANARYVVPSPNAEDEEMAHCMADASYCACVDNFTDDITKEEADGVWEQCLIDARRMICEPEYEDIFRG